MTELTYEEFIQNILNTRGRFACGDEYHERHHIVPRCMGGSDKKENLIDLFAREHFIAHKLLVQENPNNNKLIYAYNCMAFPKNDIQKRYVLTPEEYEEVRKVIHCSGDKNPFYGKHHSEETCKKLSEIKSEDKNPMYGKRHSEKSKEKMKKSRKRKNSRKNNNIVQLSLLGEYITEYIDTYEAHKITGINANSIKKCCNLKPHYKTAGGFIWMWKDEYERLKLEEIQDYIEKLFKISKRIGSDNPRSKIIIQFDKNFNIIGIWNYIKQASDCLQIKTQNIVSCCRYKINSAGGYKWRYLYDQTDQDGTIIKGAITLGFITEEKALKMLEEQKEINN